MAAITPASAVNTQATNVNFLGGTGAAQDFFGSQAFGTSIYPQTQVPQSAPSVQTAQQSAAPIGSGTFESQLFQEYLGLINQSQAAVTPQTAPAAQAQTTTTAVPQQTYGAPTIQDYMMANQIASLFSNNNSMPYMYSNTSFAEGDIFAQQTFGTTPATAQTPSQNSQQGQKFEAVS